MRKILITVLILTVTMSILWIFAGRQISEVIDRFGTVEFESRSIHSISYQRTDNSGELAVDVPPGRLFLDLAPLNPHIGTNKENQLALANAGRVFAFGPLRSAEDEFLAAEVPNADTAFVKIGHSLLPWLDLTMLKANHFLAFRRHSYFKLVWTKSNRANIKMLWQSKGDGDEMVWPTNGFDDSSLVIPPLIRIEISDAPR